MAADGAARTLERSVSSVVSARLPGRHPAVTFAIYAAPFFLLGFGYEGLRRLMRFRGEVHVGDLFELERRLFPVTTSSGTLALSDVIALNTNALLDLVTGVTYFLFMLEVFGVAIYLFFRARPKMLELSLGFFLVNIVGWSIWLLFPAAPPWYVDAYGTGPALAHVAASSAGLARFDALIHFPLAEGFYAKSANVFGAMPSLHVAYAILVAWVAFPLGGKVRLLTVAFALSMAFSAVYLRHHYILDVLAGALLAAPLAVLGKRAAVRVRSSLEAAT